MDWRVTADINEFEDAAGAFLLSDPVRNTVLLTVVASLKTSGATTYGDAAPAFGWYGEGPEVRAVFLRTPPMPALVSDAPDQAMEALVGVLAGVPGLTGPVESLRAFAGFWHAAHGAVQNAPPRSECPIRRAGHRRPEQERPRRAARRRWWPTAGCSAWPS